MLPQILQNILFSTFVFLFVIILILEHVSLKNLSNVSADNIPRSDRAPKKNRLHVLSLNAFLRAGVLRHEHGERKRYRAHALIGLLRDYDVLVLQEVWAFRHSLLKLLRKDFPYVVGSIPRSILKGIIVDSGTLIISRIPVSSSHAELFCTSKHPDSLSAKGILHAHINGVHFFNTHMQAVYTRHAEEDINNIQREQMLQLGAFIARHARSEPAVVCGDFNMTPDNPNFALLSNSGFSDKLGEDKSAYTAMISYKNDREVCTTIRSCAKCAKKYRTKADVTHVPLRLDFIFTRGMTVDGARVVKTRGLSDHDGVEAFISVTGETDHYHHSY